jgi:thiopeptide-type bacteriocin biosynthesis protein
MYCHLAGTARDLLGGSVVSNFFFMHKPPGLRARFETTGRDQRELEDDLYNRLATWQDDGVIEGVEPGVYEPENHLFGGSVSMRSVHQLFTIDSLAWLDYHAHAAVENHLASPAWLLSLVMLRALFSGLGITDWEDLDVWDRVRRRTGRSLPDEAFGEARFASVAEAIRSEWSLQQELIDRLSPRVRAIADVYRRAVIPVTTRWRSEYFATRHTYVGPREAATYLTIFHWNRAALSLTRQALLTESLAARQVD